MFSGVCALRPRAYAWVVVLGLIGAWPAIALGQIFLTNYANDSVGEYTLSGAPINTALISGLYVPQDIAASGTNLFITTGEGVVAEYTTSGALVNPSLVSGLASPYGLAVSGSDLFVADPINGTIGEYTTSGTPINPSLITGLTYPWGVAVSGSDLFVTYLYGSDDPGGQTGNVAEYDTSGDLINPILITGLNTPHDLVVSGSDLFVAEYNGIGEFTTSGGVISPGYFSTGSLDYYGCAAVVGSDLYYTVPFAGRVGEYTTSGTLLNQSLISNAGFPFGIAIVPEPSILSLLAAGAALGLGLRRAGRKRNGSVQ
jgi:hypothetical protein